MKLLLTAFEPFGGETVNPTLEALQRMPDEAGGALIHKLRVPVVFHKAIGVVTQEMARLCPDAVLCLGQAGGRAAITPERVAINVDDATIADNEGDMPRNRAIYENGPAAYFSTLPIHDMVDAMRALQIPAAISNTAGTFVCNHLMYGVLHSIHCTGGKTAAGFIHVPYLPQQVIARAAPSMSLDMIVNGITAAVCAIASSFVE